MWTSGSTKCRVGSEPSVHRQTQQNTWSAALNAAISSAFNKRRLMHRAASRAHPGDPDRKTTREIEMSLDMRTDKNEPPRKPLWPWLLLLVLTLLAIYSYHWFNRMVDDLIVNMPSAVVELLDQLLGYEARREQPHPDQNWRIVSPTQ